MLEKFILPNSDLYNQFWQLGFDGEFDLLKTLMDEQGIEAVDFLNFSPIAEDSLEKGITLAWILAFKEQWILLEEFSDQERIKVIDLNAAPQAEGNPYEGATLALY